MVLAAILALMLSCVKVTFTVGMAMGLNYRVSWGNPLCYPNLEAVPVPLMIGGL